MPEFIVSYRLKSVNSANGTVVGHRTEDKILSSDTDDLNEVFTDLFYLHRYEGLTGLEILEIRNAQRNRAVEVAEVEVN